MDFPFRKKKPDLDQAFVSLLEDHKEQLYRIAYSYVRNEHDALEVIQDSVCKGYSSLTSLKKPEFMKTWFVRIVINTAISYSRKQKRTIPMDVTEDVTLDREAPRADHASTTVEKLGLEQALTLLRDKEKAIVLLRFFEDWKLDQIASTLDLPLNTVKSTLYRALKKMKINLEEGFDHE